MDTPDGNADSNASLITSISASGGHASRSVVTCKKCGRVNELGRDRCAGAQCRAALRGNQLARRHARDLGAADTAKARVTVADLVANRKVLTGRERVYVGLLESLEALRLAVLPVALQDGFRTERGRAAIDTVVRLSSEFDRLARQIAPADPETNFTDVLASLLAPQDDDQPANDLTASGVTNDAAEAEQGASGLSVARRGSR